MSSDEVPAMDDDRPGLRRCGGFDPAQEGQQAGGVVRHAVLRPGGEVELAHLVFGGVTPLEEAHKQKTFSARLERILGVESL